MASSQKVSDPFLTCVGSFYLWQPNEASMKAPRPGTCSDSQGIALTAVAWGILFLGKQGKEGLKWRARFALLPRADAVGARALSFVDHEDADARRKGGGRAKRGGGLGGEGKQSWVLGGW